MIQIKNFHFVLLSFAVILSANLCNAQTPENVQEAFVEVTGNKLIRETFLYADTNFVYFEKSGEYFKIPQSEVINSIGIKTIPTTDYYQDMYLAGKTGTTAVSLQITGIVLSLLSVVIPSDNPESKLPVLLVGAGGVLSLTGIILEIGAWSKLKEANMKMAAKVVHY